MKNIQKSAWKMWHFREYDRINTLLPTKDCTGVSIQLQKLNKEMKY